MFKLNPLNTLPEFVGKLEPESNEKCCSFFLSLENKTTNVFPFLFAIHVKAAKVNCYSHEQRSENDNVIMNI